MPKRTRAWLGWRAREAVLAGYTSAAMQQATLAVYGELLPGFPAWTTDQAWAETAEEAAYFPHTAP